MLRTETGTNAINDILLSDEDRTRSPSPAGAADCTGSVDMGHTPAGGRLNNLPTPSQPAFQSIDHRDFSSRSGEPALSQRLILKSSRPHGSSPAPPRSTSQPPGYNSTVNGLGSRRSRPETSHQKAVTMNRKMRIDRILFKKLAREHRQIQEQRTKEGHTKIFRAMKRIRDLPDAYDSEDAIDQAWGPGGLLPNSHNEPEDYGEEAIRMKKVLDRAVRRLLREEDDGLPSGSRGGYIKRKRKRDDVGTGDEQSAYSNRKRSRLNHGRAVSSRGPVRGGMQEEGLDELDFELLGESRDEDQMDAGMDAGEDSDDVTEDETIDGG